jgi:hypothetical protein
MTASLDLKQRLERKATFEAAVKELTFAVQALSTADSPTALNADLVTRVHTLLKARYSNPAFWKAGLELFIAVEVCVCAFCMGQPGTRCTAGTASASTVAAFMHVHHSNVH